MLEYVADPGIITLSPWHIIWARPAFAIGFFWIVKTISSKSSAHPDCVPVILKVIDPTKISFGLKV